MTELKNTEASVEADEESRVQDRPGSLGPGATVWEHLAQVSPRIKNNPNTYEAQQLNRASLDQCVKCTICETQCPVAKATPLFSGPKFVGPQAERFRNGESVDHTLDYCSSCGICTLTCPQGVRIAELNSMARAVMKQGHMPLRDRIITQTELEGKLLTPFAPVANWALKQKPIRVAVEKVVGVHRNAPMPVAQSQSVQGWLKKRKGPAARRPGQPDRGPVVFFTGCAGSYFEVETSKKTIEVLEHLGFEVLVPKQGCCGLAEQSNGLFNGARAHVRKLCAQLNAAGKDLTIISSSGSCAGMIKHEAHEIMGVDDPEVMSVGTRMRETSEFLLEMYDEGLLPTDFVRIDMKLPYHAPCQVKSQGMGMPAIRLMELVPGIEVVESGENCCGIAGTYGLKKEKYDVAQEVGKNLFRKVKETNDKLAVCDTETCRWQIRNSTGVPTVHPIHVIHAAYGLSSIHSPQV
ncbi:anaerobic glycerol-3-phosphate dehydrogenase subunit C [Propionibacterium freudenreichii]|uniref:anaerobic glycerol-3-phosphate dehydrogenase subunit C n=1 Tax=Propionibacterium freudenreichii TaxID=1744 RepID=UPI0021A68052|nr:anaerobic glycerol-3-phosphate dehydrogenase subunit C [Propionibacterium freudenreichii]